MGLISTMLSTGLIDLSGTAILTWHSESCRIHMSSRAYRAESAKTIP
jgi:hypothetical protein